MQEVDPILLDSKLQLHILKALENNDAAYADVRTIPVPPEISNNKMLHNVHFLKIKGYIEAPKYIGSNILESGKLRFRTTPEGKRFIDSFR